MAIEKNLFSAIGDFAIKISQLLSEAESSQEDKNNAEVCAIVKKMMTRKNMDAEEFNMIIQKLAPLYGAGYRHSYSDISSTIYAEKQKGENDINSINSEPLDILGDNNEKLHKRVEEYYQTEEGKKFITDEQIFAKYHKLYDHIKLEIVRLNNYDTQIKRVIELTQNSNNSIESKIDDFNQRISETSKDIDGKFETKLEDVKRASDKMKSEYISILGIFSSIVLAFVGGMAFSTSVLENINKASIYRLVLVAFIVGIVFFNIICVLMEFIKRIHENTTPKNINELLKDNLLWIVVNVILIAGIIFMCWAYKCDWFEKEEQITTQKNQQQQQEEYIETS